MESGNGEDYLEFSDFSLFYILPNELIISIFGYLSVRDLCWRVSRVCKQWHSLASDSGLWKDLYAKQWINLPSSMREKVDYDAFRGHSLRLRQPHPKCPGGSAASPVVLRVGPALLDALRTIPTLEKADAALALYSTGKKPTKGEEALMTQKEDEEEAIYDASQLTPPPQRNAASELEDDADLSGDDSGDDSGDEGDDSGDEGSDIASEDEAVLASKAYLSGDELGFSPRMVRTDSGDALVDENARPASASSSSSSSSSTSAAAPSAAAQRELCDDETSEEENDLNDDAEDDDEVNKGTFECFTESFSSPTVSASSLPSSPFSSTPASPAVVSKAAALCRRSTSRAGDVNDEVDWRGSFAERMKKGKNWRGKPNYVGTLRGHTLAVMSVISNGRSAASCSLDGTIRTWDLDKRRCTGVFSGHTDWVNSIDHDVSQPDLDYVVSGSYDTSVRLWDTKNRKCNRVLWGHQNIVWSVQLAGNRVVSCSSDATVRVWDVEAGVCTQTLTGHDAAIYCCQYDPARNVVVTGSMDKTIRFWDLNASGNIKSGCVGVMRGHTDRLCCMQEDPRENLLVTGSRDSTIRLWDTRVLEGGVQAGRSGPAYNSAGDSRACFRVLRGHEGRVCCLQFDEDKIVSGSDDNTVKVWSLHGKSAAGAGGRSKARATTSSSSSSSSSSLASKTAEPSYCINTFTAHDYWVNSLKFRDNQLISGAADDTIKIWDFSGSAADAKQRQRAGGSGGRKTSGSSSGLWYADVVSSRPRQTYITNPITSACVLS